MPHSFLHRATTNLQRSVSGGLDLLTGAAAEPVEFIKGTTQLVTNRPEGARRLAGLVEEVRRDTFVETTKAVTNIGLAATSVAFPTKGVVGFITRKPGQAVLIGGSAAALGGTFPGFRRYILERALNPAGSVIDFLVGSGRTISTIPGTTNQFINRLIPDKPILPGLPALPKVPAGVTDFVLPATAGAVLGAAATTIPSFFDAPAISGGQIPTIIPGTTFEDKEEPKMMPQPITKPASIRNVIEISIDNRRTKRYLNPININF